MLTKEERENEEKFLRDRYMSTLTPEALERLVCQLCDYRVIRARKTWLVGSDEITKRASVVGAWEIINVIDGDVPMKFMYSNNVISDYRGRFSFGNYVFTSQIVNFDEGAGLIHTGNSLYCLEGDGEELNATMREAYNMRSLGQSLHVLRNVEGQLGTNSSIRGTDSDS